jgi:CspA family cold shock protein
MTTGTVKFFNEHKGYGFIAPDGGGNDAFVHISAVERSGMRSLRQDQRVSYDLQQDNRGKMSAVNLRDADEAAAGEAESGQAE